jgi:hypothetical protein
VSWSAHPCYLALLLLPSNYLGKQNHLVTAPYQGNLFDDVDFVTNVLRSVLYAACELDWVCPAGHTCTVSGALTTAYGVQVREPRNTLHYIALHCTSLHCSALHWCFASHGDAR